MVSKQVIGSKEIQFNEKSFLLQVCGFFDRTKLALESKDFAIAQGALRGIFNGLGGLVQDSDYLTKDRKTKLNKLNDSIFKIRSELVNGVEVKEKDLAIIIKENNIYERLADNKKVLGGYIQEWYEV